MIAFQPDEVTAFRPGDVVNITLMGVRIREQFRDGSVTVDADCGGQWPMPPQAAIERVAPPEWPPRHRDVWVDRDCIQMHGFHKWWTSQELLRDGSPLTLVRREEGTAEQLAPLDRLVEQRDLAHAGLAAYSNRTRHDLAVQNGDLDCAECSAYLARPDDELPCLEHRQWTWTIEQAERSAATVGAPAADGGEAGPR